MGCSCDENRGGRTRMAWFYVFGDDWEERCCTERVHVVRKEFMFSVLVLGRRTVGKKDGVERRWK